MPLLSVPQFQTLLSDLSKPHSAPVDTEDVKDFSVYATALRAAINTAPATSFNNRIVVVSLLDNVLNTIHGSIDNLEVLLALINKFGATFGPDQILQTHRILLNAVKKEKGLVKKRAITCLAAVAKLFKPAEYRSLMEFVVAEAVNDPFLCGSLAQSTPKEFEQYTSVIIPKLFDSLGVPQEDEIDQSEISKKEEVFSALNTIFNKCEHLDEHIPDALSAIKVWLLYNPSFYDDGDDNIFNSSAPMEQDEDDGDDAYDQSDYDGDEDFDIDDAEDDDQSWKLRRHAATLAASIAAHNSDNLPYIFSNLLKFLVVRAIKEREETVIVTLYSVLTSLIKLLPTFTSGNHKKRKTSQGAASFEDPVIGVCEAFPTILRYVTKDLGNKATSDNVKQEQLKLVGSIVDVTKTIPDEEGYEFINVLSYISVTPQVLNLVMSLLESQSSVLLNRQIKVLVDIVVKGISDNYYSSVIEGLECVKLLLPILLAEKESNQPSSLALKAALESRISDDSFDTECRRKAISCMSSLISTGCLLNKDDILEGSNAVVKALENELLRVFVLRAVTDFSTFAVKSGALTYDWIFNVAQTVTELLQQDTYSVRIESLSALHTLVEILSEGNQTSFLDHIASSLIAFVRGFTDPDLKEVSIIGAVVDIFAEIVNEIQDQATKRDILNFAKVVVAENYAPKIEEPVLKLISRVKDPLYEEYSQLIAVKQGLVPAALAIIIVNKQMTGQIVEILETVAAHNDKTETALIVFGNIAKRMPLDVDLEPVYSCFDLADETIRLAAANSLGDAIIGNTTKYLPELIQKLKSDKLDFLHLYSLRKAICFLETHVNVNMDQINDIWTLLYDMPHVHGFGDKEYRIIGEIMGRISFIDPEKYLVNFSAEFTSETLNSRICIIYTLNFFFGLQSEKQDRYLRPVISQITENFTKFNLNTRKLLLGSLTSAIHSKLYLLLPFLSDLVPLLYKETEINQELIRLVPMGPFKHKIDDGLDLRKAAYECLFTLATSLPPEWRVNHQNTIFRAIFNGLNDEHDLSILACVTLGQLADVNTLFIRPFEPEDDRTTIEIVFTKLRALMEKARKAMTNTSNTSLKLDVENSAEVERSIVRTCDAIDLIVRDMNFSSWVSFLEYVRESKPN